MSTKIERPTPETDAAWAIQQDFPHDDDGDPWALCSKLERQRDEARELARELRDALKRAVAYPTTGDWYCDAEAALTKAKEVLP